MSQKRYIVIIKLPGSGGLLPQAEDDSHCFPRSTNCENSFDQEMSSIWIIWQILSNLVQQNLNQEDNQALLTPSKICLIGGETKKNGLKHSLTHQKMSKCCIRCRKGCFFSTDWARQTTRTGWRSDDHELKNDSVMPWWIWIYESMPSEICTAKWTIIILELTKQPWNKELLFMSKNTIAIDYNECMPILQNVTSQHEIYSELVIQISNSMVKTR
jgi:hypothetical protein